jgi:uncharacterized membrane protein YkvA (DUF1232 family)
MDSFLENDESCLDVDYETETREDGEKEEAADDGRFEWTDENEQEDFFEDYVRKDPRMDGRKTPHIGSRISNAFRKSADRAAEILGDEQKVEHILTDLEHKLSKIPKVGKHLSYAPLMAMMIRSYVKKEYTEVPVGTIIGMLAVLIYVVNPLDVIPDSIPGIGYIDDAAVMMFVLNSTEDDLDKYEKWRKENGREV